MRLVGIFIFLIPVFLFSQEDRIPCGGKYEDLAEGHFPRVKSAALNIEYISDEVFAEKHSEAELKEADALVDASSETVLQRQTLLFKAMNYHKRLADEKQTVWNGEHPDETDARPRTVQNELRSALKIRDTLFKASSPLVSSAAKRVHSSYLSHDEKSQEASLMLLVAIDHFDYLHDGEFSGYAMTVLFQSLIESHINSARFVHPEKELDPIDPIAEEPGRLVEIRQATKVFRKAFKKLSPDEQAILSASYGLKDGRMQGPEEIGERLGMTKKQVERLEYRAIDKLSRVLWKYR